MNAIPLSELEAVNTILQNMGEAPVTSLVGDLPLDASKALATLKEVSVSVQTRGWFWNREVTTLAPDENGRILLPSNTLEVKSVDGTHLTIRQNALYAMGQGGIFTSPVKLELTLMLDFIDLPASARIYVSLKASRIYQARELGDQLLFQNDTMEEQMAWATIQAEDNANSRRSLKSSKSVSMVTERYALLIGY